MDYLQKNPFIIQIMNIVTASRAIMFSIFSALVLCLLYIYFMSIFAEYVAWAIIVLTQISFVVVCLGSLFYMTRLPKGDGRKKAALGIAIVSGIIGLLFCLALWCGWNQLKLAIEIVNCSADFLAGHKRLLCVPLIYYGVLCVYFIFWASCILSVESMGRLVPNPNYHPYIPFKKDIKWDDRKE